MVWTQKQTYRSMEQDTKPRNKSTHLRSINDKRGKICNEKRTVSSINDAGKTGQLQVKMKLEDSLTLPMKINLK